MRCMHGIHTHTNQALSAYLVFSDNDIHAMLTDIVIETRLRNRQGNHAFVAILEQNDGIDACMHGVVCRQVPHRLAAAGGGITAAERQQFCNIYESQWQIQHSIL